MYCPMCQRDVPDGEFCQRCGHLFTKASPVGPSSFPGQAVANPPYSPPYPVQSSHGPGRKWAIASVVLGAASLFLLPILLAPLGVAFGVISLVKQRKANNLAILGIGIGLLGFFGAILATMLLA